MSKLQRVTHLPAPPPRPDDGHKGTFGSVLIVAGSRGMSGAAVLAGLAALRGGAGLVTVATPLSAAAAVSAANPCYLSVPLAENDQGQLAGDSVNNILQAGEKASVVAIGPGLGQSTDVLAVVQKIYCDCDKPVLVDADGLNVLASLSNLPQRNTTAARIFTPHPGEFSRLTGESTAQLQTQRSERSLAYARQNELVLLLKGSGTIITDGERLAVNTTGNSGMATGGAGDVLTGLIAALVAQGMSAFEASQLGAHLHGAAGDAAAAQHSRYGMIATDLIDHLGDAWQQV